MENKTPVITDTLAILFSIKLPAIWVPGMCAGAESRRNRITGKVQFVDRGWWYDFPRTLWKRFTPNSSS